MLDRIIAALRIKRIDGVTVRLCPFCERCGVEVSTQGYRCEGCGARGTIETLAIYVLGG